MHTQKKKKKDYRKSIHFSFRLETYKNDIFLIVNHLINFMNNYKKHIYLLFIY